MITTSYFNVYFSVLLFRDWPSTWHAGGPPGEVTEEMKNRSIGVTGGSRNQISEFWDPLRISGTVEATNSKFGKQMDPEGN